MKKTDFFNLLANSIKKPRVLVISDASTDRDVAYNRTYSAVYMHYENTTERSPIKTMKCTHNDPKIKAELAKYKKWFNDYNSL